MEMDSKSFKIVEQMQRPNLLFSISLWSLPQRHFGILELDNVVTRIFLAQS